MISYKYCIAVRSTHVFVYFLFSTFYFRRHIAEPRFFHSAVVRSPHPPVTHPVAAILQWKGHCTHRYRRNRSRPLPSGGRQQHRSHHGYGRRRRRRRPQPGVWHLSEAMAQRFATRAEGGKEGQGRFCRSEHPLQSSTGSVSTCTTRRGQCGEDISVAGGSIRGNADTPPQGCDAAGEGGGVDGSHEALSRPYTDAAGTACLVWLFACSFWRARFVRSI